MVIGEETKKTFLTQGYLSMELPKGMSLVDEINKLRKEKNAIILAHYYQRGAIQDIADYLGDSLQLARVAERTHADMIVFCGVHFMAETAKILNPTKKVILPDRLAGCSLADSCSREGLRALREKHPGALVVTYVNCDSGVKAESDIIVTSSNAQHIIQMIPKEQEIIFAPDRNLGRYLNQVTGRDMILWDGACIVHEAFSIDRIIQQMLENPNAKLIAHPESDKLVLKVAHFVGSTSGLLEYVVQNEAQEFIVATEEGILHEMRKRAPHKKIIPAPIQDETCHCSQCHFMKCNTMEKLYWCMKYELPEIVIDEDLRLEALKPIQKMLQWSQHIK